MKVVKMFGVFVSLVAALLFEWALNNPRNAANDK
jgi:hypothetical protein